MELGKWMDISEEIQNSIKENGPVVALESTIISHGMPFPQNLETALEVESIIRKEGAIPATIAGGTTVAASMICASMAGISVFVTGGIGGVHRGSEKTMDISGDLMELARTNVAVVCAGIKSILDIPRTLEYLETQGVPVIGYRTDEFPAFYTTTSGYSVQSRINTAEEIARCMKVKWELGLEGGMVIANPVLREDAMDEEVIEEAITKSLKEASEKGIDGKAVTPFLLERISQLTDGESLKTNIALVCNNALVGAKIASAYGNEP